MGAPLVTCCLAGLLYPSVYISSLRHTLSQTLSAVQAGIAICSLLTERPTCLEFGVFLHAWVDQFLNQGLPRYRLLAPKLGFGIHDGLFSVPTLLKLSAKALGIIFHTVDGGLVLLRKVVDCVQFTQSRPSRGRDLIFSP